MPRLYYLYQKFSQQTIVRCLLGYIALSVSTSFWVNTSHAEVYKIVDKNTGQITFTDEPQGYIQHSATFEKVTLDTRVVNKPNFEIRNTLNHGTTVQNAQDNSSIQTQKKRVSKPRPQYAVTILSPTKSRAYQSSAESIELKADLSSPLKKDDTLVWMMDGNELTRGSSASIPTAEIPAGEHTLQVKVINKQDIVLTESDEHIFYIVQRNNIVRVKKAQAAAAARYNALPWYKKLKLSIKGQKPKIVK